MLRSLLGSGSADGAVLDAAPSAAVLQFDEAVGLIALRLVGPDGRAVPLGPVEAGSSVLRAAVPTRLPNGVYLLSWRVTSELARDLGRQPSRSWHDCLRGRRARLRCAAGREGSRQSIPLSRAVPGGAVAVLRRIASGVGWNIVPGGGRRDAQVGAARSCRGCAARRRSGGVAGRLARSVAGRDRWTAGRSVVAAGRRHHAGPPACSSRAPACAAAPSRCSRTGRAGAC